MPVFGDTVMARCSFCVGQSFATVWQVASIEVLEPAISYAERISCFTHGQ